MAMLLQNQLEMIIYTPQRPVQWYILQTEKLLGLYENVYFLAQNVVF